MNSYPAASIVTYFKSYCSINVSSAASTTSRSSKCIHQEKEQCNVFTCVFFRFYFVFLHKLKNILFSVVNPTQLIYVQKLPVYPIPILYIKCTQQNYILPICLGKKRTQTHDKKHGRSVISKIKNIYIHMHTRIRMKNQKKKKK